MRTIIQSVLTWWRASGCGNSLPYRGRVESHINSFLSITSEKISLWKFSYPKQAPNFSKKLLKDPSLLLPLGNSHSSLAGSITDFFTENFDAILKITEHLYLKCASFFIYHNNSLWDTKQSTLKIHAIIQLSKFNFTSTRLMQL